MTHNNTPPNTVRLHRIIRCPADRLYRAFLDPRAMVKWSPPHGFVGEVQSMDARVGGGYRMSFTNFNTGQTHSFGGTYLELTPHSRIRYNDRFDDPSLAGQMQITVTLRPVACGTELEIVQENVPPQIPVEFCYMGWQESLSMLAALVEPEIP
ncbi:MAG: SRPBCC family protein [Phycisphaerae bacterium]|nr:SRPBCC family protein [Phycisphaerae bacterium]